MNVARFILLVELTEHKRLDLRETGNKGAGRIKDDPQSFGLNLGNDIIEDACSKCGCIDSNANNNGNICRVCLLVRYCTIQGLYILVLNKPGK